MMVTASSAVVYVLWWCTQVSIAHCALPVNHVSSRPAGCVLVNNDLKICAAARLLLSKDRLMLEENSETRLVPE